jgi:glucose-6-phosphate 1-dehydrogenase
MRDAPCDAFVFFGATGDLAYKKIFPALHAMVKRGHLDMPIVGVAKSGWTVDQFRACARESVERHGGGADAAACATLCRLLRYVDGDYRGRGDLSRLARAARDGASARALSGHPTHALPGGRRSITERRLHQRRGDHRETLRP